MSNNPEALRLGDLWKSGNWYAVLDGARDAGVQRWLSESRATRQSLYAGEGAAEHEDWAPYLVALNEADCECLAKESWGNSWGIFFRAPVEFAAVRGHLRRFLTVRMPEGKTAYFRFYDPRVLRDFLPSWTATELVEFFGPVEGFVLDESERAGMLYFLRGEQLEMRPVQAG